MIKLIKLLKCLHSGELTFVACRRQDGKDDQFVCSRGIIPSISFFDMGTCQVLEELEC